MSSQSAPPSLIEAALAFFFPPICQLCNASRATAAQGYVCPACSRRVRHVSQPLCERCGFPFEGSITGLFECSNCREMEFDFAFARSAVVARDVVLEVIHRYKYNRAMWFEPFLADLLVRAATGELSRDDWDVIVPVPLHPIKLREREFNQAEHLARRLGLALGIPCHNTWLRRVERTRTQTLLSRSERSANVRKAFAIRHGLKLEGQRVVVVDDVFTTGATTSACARVLKAAGAGEVCVWTVARGI